MPMHKNNDDLVDPDLVPRPVMALGLTIVAGADGMELVAHHHRKAQLIYMARGVLTCEVSQGLWIVPPQCAVWIPGGTRHSVKGVGAIDVYSLFVEPASAPTLPDACCTVSVSPLLRELLLRCARFPTLYPVKGAESRLVTVLLDELAAAPVEKLHLPMPSDGGLRKIADGMTADPADRATVHEWAERIGVSERTLRRLVPRETGMSFGRWRQQLHIILALQWLSQGASVQSVATDLGYESASSFVLMFRKALGASPARYMTQRLAGAPPTASEA
ncbi:Transcriptional regulator, AraC family [Fimbriiglobus ruber]|uniref:Transcriptional regulator, AraC family n=1 Tax=Fimbriiglobus ruber TaxID=1908690 RepID=A0A225D9U9_9BACT|nr:Transcriptional regulator, AraC family [Fimbriiglobus ruber]